MTLIARFIGIDRYRDPDIQDLAGAARDARAIWALFADSIPEADTRLIADQHATHANVSAAIDDTLGKAAADDTVVLMFAGHGTRDHRLVLHDTSVGALQSTTISMEDLAESFKRSSARAVLCILDCCFSGAAPARVLESSPVSRTAFLDLPGLTGTGRMLLAASRLDQPAYEHPQHRHGLLTYALLRVLQEGTGMVSLGAAFDEVLQIVRTEAAALGMDQTPVLLGLVEGGLTIPVLRKGTRFLEAFPESRAYQVSKAMSDLLFCGVPDSVVNQWSARYSEGLNSLQQTAINEFGVLRGESVFVVAPTSAGKTFVGEMGAVRAVAEGKKAVFLLPYRALVNEKFEDFQALYGAALNLRVVRCTGDYTDQTLEVIHSKFDIALLTFEMFLGLSVANPSLLYRLGLVVIDEAQFITDATRGIVVELILTLLRTFRERGVKPQLIALSATVGAMNHFDEWIGTPALHWRERPVPLVFGALDRHGVYRYQAADGSIHEERMLDPRDIVQIGPNPSARDVLVPLARKLLADQNAKEKLLLFRNRTGSTEGSANYLARDLGLPPATEVIESLPAADLSTSSEGLRRALAGGVAFHSADLARDERVAVERAFRDRDGPVRVLVATTTVAAGVNTPASTVVIVEHDRPWIQQPYAVAEIKNMAGRAGRLGYRETGRAIILADNPLERERLVRHFVQGEPEPLSSSFHESNIATWVMRLFAQAGTIRANDVAQLLVNTFGGYLLARNDPGWRQRTQATLATLIQRMLTASFLSQDGEFLSLTLLGKACGSSSLSFESTLRLIEMLRVQQERALQPLRLMALVQGLTEMDETFTPLARRGQREAIWPSMVAQRLGADVASALQLRAADVQTYWARAKRTCILLKWIDGLPIAGIERQSTVNPFSSVGAANIRAIADATRFYLSSAYRIAVVMYPAGDSAEAMDRLMKRLELGIPDEALGLLELPVAFGRGEYLALFTGGVRTTQELWALTTAQITQLVGARVATRLSSLRPAAES